MTIDADMNKSYNKSKHERIGDTLHTLVWKKVNSYVYTLIHRATYCQQGINWGLVIYWTETGIMQSVKNYFNK